MSAAIKDWSPLVEKAVAILGSYLPPDGIGQSEVVEQLVELFDGPEYRTIRDATPKVQTVTMNGHQIKQALEFANPDGDRDMGQQEDEFYFGVVQHKDDNDLVRVGLCMWNDDTDGVYPLHDAP